MFTEAHQMSSGNSDSKRRKFLVAATTSAGALGAGMTAVPFVLSMRPSERAKAGSAPVEVGIGSLEPGMAMTVEWRGKPVWIVHRTREVTPAERDILRPIRF